MSGKEKKNNPINPTRSSRAVKNQRRILHWESKVFVLSFVQADVDQEDQSTESDAVSLINL